MLNIEEQFVLLFTGAIFMFIGRYFGWELMAYLMIMDLEKRIGADDD